MELPLEERKARLAKLVAPKRGAKLGAIRYSDHVIGNGKQFYELACKTGLEGIISKRRDKPYHPGRGSTWQKTKCLLRQELVIGGFTDPEGNREGIVRARVRPRIRRRRPAIRRAPRWAASCGLFRRR